MATKPSTSSSQWFHCRERLPTKNDADADEGIITFSPDGKLTLYYWDKISPDSNVWWTPTPKHLKPLDPFENWWRNLPPNLRDNKRLYKQAFKLGQQNSTTSPS